MPTIVTTTAGQYGTALGNSRKLFRDAYGKYISVSKNANVVLCYCNNDSPTSGWVTNNLGPSFAVDPGEAFGVAGAYDSTNDKLMVGWVGSLNLKLAQITFSRDANHNITDYTAGSVLSIAPAYVNTHNPSLWMLHNGEVATVWGDEKTSGAKHSVVKFCRVVFGSPPTYKNAAGTASSVNTISSDYTSTFKIRHPTIVERINSGTGQYDLYAFWSLLTLNFYKNKATWASPNWSWGSEAVAFTASYPMMHCFGAYDTLNSLIIYGVMLDYAVGTIEVRSINASDTDSSISVSGLASAYRHCASLAINQANGDYYIFYYREAPYNVYYVKRSGGSWGSETQFTTTANEYYPVCKVDGAGNRIELIWTHYTGSAYNVYYDYLSLVAPPTGFKKLQYFSEPPTVGQFNKLRFASEPPVPSAFNKLLYEGE